VLEEYIVDPAATPWRHGQVAGINFQCQILLSGTDGGPEALRFRFDACPSVFAHMHLTSQFQLLLHGRMDFPKSTMKLRSFAVHYSDHNFPYGPFAVGDDHDMLVLHPKQGGLVSMADRDARRQINLRGRHLDGSAANIEWAPVTGLNTLRSKHLIPPSSGPSAIMIECPPNTPLMLPIAPYGRYEVVLAGSASVCGRLLAPPGFHYLQSMRETTCLESGPDGATLMLLAFDEDAREGGLTGEGLSVAAAEAMERAI
jgi:hypothetical protein